MKRQRDRFINNGILRSLSRPQYRYGCSIASLACVVNYLFREIVTQEELAAILGLDIQDIGSRIDPSDDTLAGWFRAYCRTTKSKGTVREFLTLERIHSWSPAERERIVEKLKGTIQSRESIVVYHDRAARHYNIVCGYFESAVDKEEAFADDPLLHRWIVLADHAMHNDPVWCRRLKELGSSSTLLVCQKG